MKGVYNVGDRTVEVREVPIPEPGRGEVLVKMRAAAVCGSDLHGYRRSRESMRVRGTFIAGHEPCGDVVALGPEVHSVQVGDRVVVLHRRGCGVCEYCRSGEMSYCRQVRDHGSTLDGADADYMVTGEVNCLPLPDDYSYAVGAVLACNGGTAFVGMSKVGARVGSSLAVSGLGPVGLCSVLVAKAMGAWVVGIDVSKGRLALAQQLGADAVVDAEAGDVVAEVRRLTDGRGADLAIETSGAPRAQQAMLDFLGFRSKACVVGMGGGQGIVNLTDIVRKHIILLGSQIFGMRDYFDMLEFLGRQKVDLERVVTDRFPIEKAAEAFQLADSAATGKVIFEWP